MSNKINIFTQFLIVHSKVPKNLNLETRDDLEVKSTVSTHMVINNYL